MIFYILSKQKIARWKSDFFQKLTLKISNVNCVMCYSLWRSLCPQWFHGSVWVWDRHLHALQRLCWMFRMWTRVLLSRQRDDQQDSLSSRVLLWERELCPHSLWTGLLLQPVSIRLSCRLHKLVQSDITGWILLHLLIFNVAVIHRTHRTNISDCQPCPPGRYCQNRGATEVTGMCKAGHICYGLALYDDPVYNNDTSGNKTAILWGDTCHPGYYCPQGTSVMVACPRGTYNPDRSGTSEAASCKQCDPGKYCNGTALTEVTGQYLLCFIRVL